MLGLLDYWINIVITRVYMRPNHGVSICHQVFAIIYPTFQYESGRRVATKPPGFLDFWIFIYILLWFFYQSQGYNSFFFNSRILRTKPLDFWIFNIFFYQMRGGDGVFWSYEPHKFTWFRLRQGFVRREGWKSSSIRRFRD